MNEAIRTQHKHDGCDRFVLAIELSNPSATPGAHAVALFDARYKRSTLVGSMAIPDGLRSADGLMVAIDALCREHHCAPGSIARIIVSIGPGGYTALRIATTSAKVLAQTLGCELVALPAAAIAAQSIDEPLRPALIVLASKNERGSGVMLHVDGTIEPVGMIDAGMIEPMGVRTIVGDAHLPDSFAACALELGIERRAIVLDARQCFSAAVGVRPIEPAGLRPIYARAPDAITQWRARGR